MKSRVLSLVFVLFALPAFSQEYREWSLGPLQKAAFDGSVRSDTASFSVTWDRQPVRVKQGRSILYRYQDIRTLALLSSCAISGETITEEELGSFQRDFDLAEQYARRLRDTLLFLPAHAKQQVWKQFVSAYTSQRQHLSEESGALLSPGPDDFDITAVPLRVSSRGLAASVGAEWSVPLGDLGELCGPMVGVCPGIDLRSGRLLLSTEFSFRTGWCKDRYFRVVGLPEQRSCVYQFRWRVGPGFVLVDEDAWQLSAFLGLGSSRTVFPSGPVSGFALTEGLRFEHNLRKSYRFDVFRPSLFQTGLVSRLYMDQIWIAGNRTLSPAVNLSLGIVFSENGLSRN